MKKSALFVLSLHKVGKRLICIHTAILTGFNQNVTIRFKNLIWYLYSYRTKNYNFFERLDLFVMSASIVVAIFKSQPISVVEQGSYHVILHTIAW